MFNSSNSEVWCDLLFKFVSVPFIVLLIIVTANQSISLYSSNSSDALQQAETRRELTDDMFF
jgi:hypothetical protein